MVALGSTPFPDVLSVTLDDRPATVTLARHLESLGHQHVAVVALPMDENRERGALTPERESQSTISTPIDRLAGAREVFPDVSVVVAAGSLVDEGLLAAACCRSQRPPGRQPFSRRAICWRPGSSAPPRSSACRFRVR